MLMERWNFAEIILFYTDDACSRKSKSTGDSLGLWAIRWSMWVRLHMDRSTIQCTVVPDMLTPIFFFKTRFGALLPAGQTLDISLKCCVYELVFDLSVSHGWSPVGVDQRKAMLRIILFNYLMGMHCSSCYRLEMEHITWKEHSCRVLGQSMIT